MAEVQVVHTNVATQIYAGSYVAGVALPANTGLTIDAAGNYIPAPAGVQPVAMSPAFAVPAGATYTPTAIGANFAAPGVVAGTMYYWSAGALTTAPTANFAGVGAAPGVLNASASAPPPDILPLNNIFTGSNNFTQDIKLDGGVFISNALGSTSIGGAGQDNTGANFTGVGVAAGQDNAGANFTGMGYYAGAENTGADFTGVGVAAGRNNAGAGFTGVGIAAGRNNTGANFTGMGLSAGQNNTFDNAGCFGDNTSVTGANQIQIGKFGTTVYTYASATRSDRRDKTDIKPLDAKICTSFVEQMEFVAYRWDLRDSYRHEQSPKDEDGNITTLIPLADVARDGTHKGSRYHSGVIAQDIQALAISTGLADQSAIVKDAEHSGGEAAIALDHSELFMVLGAALQDAILRIKVLEAAAVAVAAAK
jgi:hypothetical protein